MGEPSESKSSASAPAPETEVKKHADLGEILVNEGLITRQQLDRAIKVQSRLEVKQRLTDVLVQLGAISQGQLKEMMRKNKRSLRLGDFLLEMKFINEDDLSKALKLQKISEKRLGEILVEIGILSETKLSMALAEQFDCAFIDPDLRVIDPFLLKGGLPTKQMRLHCLIPYARTPEGTIVIFHDPNNQESLMLAKQAFGDTIIPAISTRSSIFEAIDTLESGGIGKVDQHQFDIKVGDDDVVKFLDYIIQTAIDEDVSDIHIEPLSKKVRIRYRKDGVLVQKTELPKHLHPKLVSRLKIMAEADIADKLRHQDGKIEYSYFNQKIDIRFSSYVTIMGENVVLRLLSKKKGLKDLSDLGFDKGTQKKYIEQALYPTTGVVIITGPTGSGKTTTLYSSIDFCNDPSIKIITAEDPVEYIIEGIIQCSINEFIGLTFEETLRSIVRQDPDIIVLGEIRDKLSAATAMQAALTGHKVFTTFHTEDSIGGIIRLIDMDVETFMISSTVLSILAQRLLRKVCIHCRELYVPGPIELSRIGLTPDDIKGYEFFHGSGCKNCNYTGYSGRVGIYELLILNEAVKDAILQKKTSYEIRRISFEHTGLVTLLEDGILKAFKGVTTFDEVAKHVPYTAKPRPLEEILKMVE
jgi:type IV pilus assembly protein PilB